MYDHHLLEECTCHRQAECQAAHLLECSCRRRLLASTGPGKAVRIVPCRALRIPCMQKHSLHRWREAGCQRVTCPLPSARKGGSWPHSWLRIQRWVVSSQLSEKQRHMQGPNSPSLQWPGLDSWIGLKITTAKGEPTLSRGEAEPSKGASDAAAYMLGCETVASFQYQYRMSG